MKQGSNMVAYITVGAKTTHGGTVITGSPQTTHYGIPVARKGDKVVCKKCKKVVTIITGDPSYIVDGAPVARAGDMTSCGSKLIAMQQAFSESGFDVGSISDEMTDEELYAMNDQMIEDAIADGGLTAEYAMSSEELGRIIRVHGENSVVGKQAMAALKSRNDTHVYTDVEKQLESNRRQSAAARATRAQNNIKQSHVDKNNPTQQPLDMQQGQPPSLGDGLGYENPMAKVRDGWKGEAVDGIKKTGSALDGAGRQVNKGYDAGRTVLDNVLNKDTNALKDQAFDKATDTGKGKFIDKAKDIAPKPVQRAWDALDDFNAVKDKGNEIKDAIPKNN